MTTEQSSIPNTYTPKVGDLVVVREEWPSLFRGCQGEVQKAGEDQNGAFAIVRILDPSPHAKVALLRFAPAALRAR